MKIYNNKLKESWIIDRIIDEWTLYNKDIVTKNLFNSDIIWIIANWKLKGVPKVYLKNKKVVASIYHIDFENFKQEDEKNFYKLDKYVDYYHVISLKTKEQLQKLTTKRIYSIPFWVNQNHFFHISNKTELRKKYGFSKNDYILGSFQRDTEGSDLKSPKLIKGPDIFVELVKKINHKNPNLKVLLAGTRRQYIINMLKQENIKFTYFEMVDFVILNELYNLLDLYLVTSRLEGGPQAILESAVTKTPILSTDVGVASEILHENAIFSPNSFELSQPMTEYAYKKSREFLIPSGIDKFRRMFEDVYES